jgi:tryptophanyl-tRNA synthetase
MGSKVKPKVKVLTGMRSSADLTIANVIGAVKPIIDLSEREDLETPFIFVADMHALTDQEPEETQSKVMEVIRDYYSVGLNPKDFNIYVQSQIMGEIAELNYYLSRLITVAELLRVPTLKDKIKHGQGVETASALLAMYPIMMASDILIQRSMAIPVGEDQVAHVEVAKYLARKFNKRYGETFVVPNVLSTGEPVRLVSLDGSGSKMSKTNEKGAIVLRDPIDVSLSKVKKAKTAFAGESSAELETLEIIARFVAEGKELGEIEGVLKEHYAGENVMGKFKELLCNSLEKYLTDLQKKRDDITDDYILENIEKAGKIARKNAQETLKDVRENMGMKFVD